MLNKRLDSSEVKRAVAKVADQIEAQLKRAVTDRVCIGITGLSQSGKSTVITSLINQLKNHRTARLSAFSPWLTNRILAVKEHPLEDRYLKQFDYSGALDRLSGTNPSWPESTRDLSGVLLEIKLRAKSRFGRAKSRSIFVELRDYPGEWLLDLPLLNTSFYDWSVAWSKLLQAEPRASMEGNPMVLLGSVAPLGEMDQQLIFSHQRSFVGFLRHSRSEDPPLQIVQPGRFLVPGQMELTEDELFFPLIALDGYPDQQLKNGSTQSYYAELERRFERYKSQRVSRFFKQFIQPVDRQIVLVDVLAVLRGDAVRLAEMINALEMVSQSFEYGAKKRFGSRVTKVVFVATKVDQVIAKDHEAVRHLLSALVRNALDRAAYQEIEYKVEAIAAIRSSIEAQLEDQQCIQGANMAGEGIGYTHPQIPDNLPTDEDWQRFEGWSIPTLKPPRGMSAERGQALPHIRMDQLLQDILGDLCR